LDLFKIDLRALRAIYLLRHAKLCGAVNLQLSSTIQYLLSNIIRKLVSRF
jgi:hypothetical protein